MKYLYLLFFCFPLMLNAQSNGTKGPPVHQQRDRVSSLEESSSAPSELERATTLQSQEAPVRASGVAVDRAGANLEELLRKLGPDLISPRLTIDQYVLEHLLSLLEVQPDMRLVLAVDHSALSVRYALVHRLLEDLEHYPVVKDRVDVEMYAPISKYHTTWLYGRGFGHLMIRLERLSR
ncbi:MAG: hypothetical protein RIC19_08290 [Phaeodactylibacter sp.]|uniref:hypothetical protein n=1 Tax=Phaeodactylibacter sp. TaxID=1940289 RepID=UPI0032EAC7F3